MGLGVALVETDVALVEIGPLGAALVEMGAALVEVNVPKQRPQIHRIDRGRLWVQRRWAELLYRAQFRALSSIPGTAPLPFGLMTLQYMHTNSGGGI